MSCEEKIPEYYRLSADSLRNYSKFRDLIHKKQDFEDAVQEVMLGFVKSNHKDGVKNPKAYISRVAHNVLVKRLDKKLKLEKDMRPMPDEGSFDMHVSREIGRVRQLVHQFIEKNSLRSEEIDIIKDCIGRLSGEEYTLFIDYFIINNTTRKLKKGMGVSHTTVSRRCNKISRKVRDCINGE
jgi:RNA polymerase sigma factor (sigma-70 family)